MKSNKDFRGFDSAEDRRKSPKLNPIRKSGKERHNLYGHLDRDDEDDDQPVTEYRKRESAFDYFDDGSDQ